MPIHFSIGFVAEQLPRSEYVWVCGVANDSQLVDAVITMSQEVEAEWQYEGCKCE